MELPFTSAEIIKETNLHPLKIKNIFIYGSRCYGTNREDSDYDFLVVANNLLEASEIKGQKYNIHIHTPDKFKRALQYHDIHALECIYAPDWAKLQIKEEYPFKLDKLRLKKSLLNSSHNSWTKAKMKLNECDIYSGTKSAFHSLRILIFGIQIAEHGRIIDFSEANYLWKKIDACEELEWDSFKEEYLPLKIELEKKFKAL